MGKLLGDLLIVDDTPDNLALLTALLSTRGYGVRQTTSGEFALKLVQHNPPDLILLDVLMPGMDGYEVCRRLKLDAQTRQIPVLFMSALDGSLDKVRSFEVGGVDYITKPFEIPEVLARIENHLELSRLQRRLQEQTRQLEQHNHQLEQEIRDRTQAEIALQQLNQNLEAIVESRTAELLHRQDQLLELQEQLKEALDREQVLSQIKSQLLAMISHEFRTPLAVIGTSVGLLKFRLQELGEVQTQRYFDRIERSIERIVRVLDNAVILGQAQCQYIPVNLHPVHLVSFCEALLSEWTASESSPHHLQLLPHEPIPDPLQIDPFLLRRILDNLVANAIRYSPSGGEINLELQYEPGWLTLHLHDQGIGIPELEYERIFEHFYRASNADTIPGMPGAGLGLAVAKQLVELHGGTIAVKSVLNQGTTVTVTLPVGNAESID